MRLPDKRGHFGIFGGKFVPETLVPALDELTEAYTFYKKDASFKKELTYYLKEYAGRPTPLYFAERLSHFLGDAKIYLKREDLCHTGAHKINNTLGQVLLAKRMQKKRVIAETGAGQHGVATATTAALLGIDCSIYMGEKDMARQEINVFRMKLLGAEVVPVSGGSKTLKDAINEAIRDWVTNVRHTYYVIGSVVGPHPYPMIVRDFQSVIGRETRRQILRKEGRLPDYLVACVGGGSNALGLFYSFLNDGVYPVRDKIPKVSALSSTRISNGVKMIGVEAAGSGITTPHHSATLSTGTTGVLQGTMSYLLQNPDGQIVEAHSIAPGLDYPGVGPEHSYLKKSGRVQYVNATDKEALKAFKLLSEKEGIIPALESAHAVAQTCKMASSLKSKEIVIINLSGRGDKDVNAVKGTECSKGDRLLLNIKRI